MILRLILIAFLILAASVSYGQQNVAVVSKIQGFYLFTDSHPIADFEVVGEVSTEGHNDAAITKSKGQYQPVRDFLIKAARKVNYTADGLIFSLVSGGDDKALIIKFKENSIKNSQSKVNQYQGVYIFTDSEPMSGTDYITSILDRGKSNSLQYHALKERLLNICRKEQPNAKAIILKLRYGGTDSGDIVKIKTTD
ncbi:MAG: hypothetical protein V4721_03200 [Bacteroidota bacterium]